MAPAPSQGGARCCFCAQTRPALPLCWDSGLPLHAGQPLACRWCSWCCRPPPCTTHRAQTQPDKQAGEMEGKPRVRETVVCVLKCVGVSGWRRQHHDLVELQLKPDSCFSSSCVTQKYRHISLLTHVTLHTHTLRMTSLLFVRSLPFHTVVNRPSARPNVMPILSTSLYLWSWLWLLCDVMIRVFCV